MRGDIHRSFDLHFLIISKVEQFFHMPTGHLFVFFGEMSIKVFCPFSDSFFWGGGLYELIVYFGADQILSPCLSHCMQIFSPIL